MTDAARPANLECARATNGARPPSAGSDGSALADLLADQPQLRLAIIFGSLARGTATPQSDLDLAVWGMCGPLSAERTQALIEELALITGRPVDLVDLATAGIAIRRTIVREGRILFARDAAAYPEVLSRLWWDTEDFLPLYERILEGRRRAWIG